jgi:hypothetical protein
VQPVPVAVRAAEVVLKASAEARAVAPSNEEPDTTTDRSAELPDSEARDEMLLRAQTTGTGDLGAVHGVRHPAAPAPDEAPESHPSFGYLAVEDASADPKALVSQMQL